MEKSRKPEPPKSVWMELIDPNCFLTLEDKIKTERAELEELYKNAASKNPTNFQEEPMLFLSKEKKILEKIENFENKKSRLQINHDEAVDFLYDRINHNDDEHHPYIFKEKEIGDNFYCFRLTFDFEELKNPDRKYYLEVSKNSSSSRFERIHISPDDSDMKIKRTAHQIIR